MELNTFENLPAGKGVMAIMGREGDSKHIWDKSKPDEVDAARVLFNSLVTEKRYLAFKVVKDGAKGEQVREFDPNEERYIFVPPMVGG